jgi:hypothetical protein
VVVVVVEEMAAVVVTTTDAPPSVRRVRAKRGRSFPMPLPLLRGKRRREK